MTPVRRARGRGRGAVVVRAVVGAFLSLIVAARAATPTVPTVTRVEAVAGTKATVSFAGTDAEDGVDGTSVLIVSTPTTGGTVFLDELGAALPAVSAVECAGAIVGAVSARRLNAGRRSVTFSLTCDETETRREFVTNMTYRLIDSGGDCSAESTVEITVKVHEARISRFVPACTAKWISRTEGMCTSEAVDWWDPTLTLPLTGDAAENNGQFKKYHNSSSVVYGWGDNSLAQLALGHTDVVADPMTNADFESVKQLSYVATSDKTALGVEFGTGRVFGWGFNAKGLLGVDMSQVHASSVVKSPVRVGKLENVNKVALSEGHAVALDDSGYVYTWGVDDYGQLGRGWMPGMLQTVKSEAFVRSRTVPERVVNNGFRVMKAVDIAVGHAHTLALTSSGSIWAWGSNNDGQLGLKACEISRYGDGVGGCVADTAPEMPSTDSPQKIISDVTFSAVAANARYSMAIASANASVVSGQVYSWGIGESGQLGLGSSVDDPFRALRPQLVDALRDVEIVFIDAGEFHAAAIASNGEVYTWGLNTFGQLGHGDRMNRLTPTKVGALSDKNVRIQWISCGRSHTVAVSDYGEVFAWGSNEYGQLGLEMSSESCGDTLTLRGWSNTTTSSSRRRLLADYGSAAQSDVDGLFSRFAGVVDMSGRTGGSNAEFEALVMGISRPFKEGYLSAAAVGLYGEVEYVATPVIVANVQQVHMVAAAGSTTLALRVSCSAGNARDKTTGECVECLAGTYTNDFTSFSCNSCPLGHYQDQPGSSTCALCAFGTYAGTTGRTTCQSCVAGTFIPFEGASSVNFCANCPKGTFSAVSGSSECTPCEAGSYQGLTGESDCTPCPLGTFNGATGATRSTDCVPCPPGSFADDTGSSSCTPCPAGAESTSPGAQTCTTCSLGFYSTGGAINCSPCPAGTKGDASAGAIMASSTDCIACEPGEFAASTGQAVCQPCPDGSYSDQAGMSECTKCPVGYTGRVAPASRAGVDFACQACAAGTYSAIAGSVNACLECERGTYQDGIGQNTCKPCPRGTVTTVPGATSLEDCVKCGAGLYAPHDGMGECIQCERGKYGTAVRDDTSDCIPCDAGTYSLQYGSDSADNCQACQPGSFSIEGQQCEPCPAGRYQAEESQGSCDQCPQGTFLDTTGATDVSDCTPCPLGSYAANLGNTECLLCDAGTYNDQTGQGSCAPCPRGTALSATGSRSLDDCLECAEGSTAQNEGSSECQLCAPGTYSDTRAAEQCTPCPAGTYSNVEGSNSENSCIPCPVGSYAPTPQSVECSLCEAGTYSDEEGMVECKLADAGYYLPEEGATSKVNMQPCPVGKFGDIEGLEACFDCPSGTYSNTTASTACFDCPAGTFSVQEGSTSANNCLLCELGSYAPAASVSCSECDAGTYAAERGLEFCTGCPNGTYGIAIGGTSVDVCLDCPNGAYSDSTGAQSCDPCPAGTYADVPGLSACKPCGAGTYGVAEGASTGDSSVCLQCPFGTFSDGGLPSCAPCTSGTYTDVKGSVNCTLCPEGTYGIVTGAVSVDFCERCPLYHFNSTAGSTSIDACVYFHSASRTAHLALFFAVYILVIALGPV